MLFLLVVGERAAVGLQGCVRGSWNVVYSASGACASGYMGRAWALVFLTWSRSSSSFTLLRHSPAVSRAQTTPSRAPLCAQVALLRRLGADSHVVDEYQCTPMQLAVVRGHAAVVRALHAAGEDLQVVNEHRRTLVHYAAEFGHVRPLRAPQ